jgi:CTP:molybdopterin cytidylyltransferase MocA
MKSSNQGDKPACKAEGLNIGAIVLAAGEGARMGSIPKALIQMEGIPLIEHMLRALSEAGVAEMLVVTGHHHALIEPVLKDYPVQIVRNPDPALGQPSSVRLGLEAINQDLDGVIMLLCDQPLINAADITELIEAFIHRGSGEIILPMVDGKRGNPVLIGRIALKQILVAGPGMVCRNFMDQHPEMVTQLKSSNAHFLWDVDSMADLEKLRQELGVVLTLPNRPN